MEGETNRTFHGRAILPAKMAGEALVTHLGFNAYASFYNSIHGQVEAAVCADSGNRELYGKDLSGKIICLPNTVGSTSAGAVWQRIARLGVAPKAMLFSQQIDPLAAGGLIVADLWAGQRICTVDRLGGAFLKSVKDGDRIVIDRDGAVTIEPSGKGQSGEQKE
jgi:predicted aconitase with swiveling domain